MLRIALLLCCAVLLAGGEAVSVGRAEGGTLRPVVPLREVEAGKDVDVVDAKLAEARSLPPAERRSREAGMGRQLEKLVKTCEETKHANKALYLLAAWRLTYAGGDGVGPLIDRIFETKYPAYQQAARMLRVQWLVSVGRIPEARIEADSIASQVPEFAGVRDIVAFHEQIGKPAPRTAGTPLAGAPADPGTREERFLLYYFANTLDEEGRYQLGLYLDELKRPEYAGVVRLVCVINGGNPLTAAGALQGLPGAERVDLLWASPGADGDARAWAEAWKLPGLPANALLGPDRMILAVQPAPTDLRALVGKPVPNNKKPAATGNDNRGGKSPWGR